MRPFGGSPRRVPAVLAVAVLTCGFWACGSWGQVRATEPAIDTLAPADLMARYQAECLDRTVRDAARTDAGRARAHGTRCDALAEAIQSLDQETKREGSADLARPDFYTPGQP